MKPGAIFTWAQGDPVWTVGLQNCKVNLFVLSQHGGGKLLVHQ